MNLHRRHLVRAVWAFAWMLLATACSTDAYPEPEGGAPIDAPPGLDRAVGGNAPDGQPHDVPPDVSSSDAAMVDSSFYTDSADARCSCTRADGGFFPAGAISLPCYCATSSWPSTFTRRPPCMSYDTVMSCPDGGHPFVVQTYAGCNLVVVQFDVSNAADFNVYDRTTHELIGAMRADDYPSSFCGSERVVALQAGIVPGPECELTKTEEPCRPSGDGGIDARAGDVDAGCACTAGDGGIVGEQSLGCFCAGGNGPCPSYDEARLSCPSGASPESNRIDVHAACNLVVMTAGHRFGGETYVFDATTHELVGAARMTDANALTCGSTRVFGYRAGIFPPPDCPVSRSIDRCPGDGGTSPEGGGASDAACRCDLNDAGDNGIGHFALPCYCASLGSCRSYEDALRACETSFHGLSTLEEFPGCNLAVFSSRPYYSFLQYAYDYTTRALVGVWEGGDIPTYACGSTMTYSRRAGVFPDASCVRARSVSCVRGADAAGDVNRDGD